MVPVKLAIDAWFTAAGLNPAYFLLTASAQRRSKTIMNRKKILVVDDDRVFQYALSLKLNAKGYEVVKALDGSQAVGAIRKHNPDLILLDMNFPANVGTALDDGFRIMEWLKRVQDAAQIPIIVITGGGPDDFEKRIKAVGDIEVFHKPVNHEQLFTAIRKTLGEELATS